jgi:CRISPR/Cas system-associated endoribonuclease Cas2
MKTVKYRRRGKVALSFFCGILSTRRGHVLRARLARFSHTSTIFITAFKIKTTTQADAWQSGTADNAGWDTGGGDTFKT